MGSSTIRKDLSFIGASSSSSSSESDSCESTVPVCVSGVLVSPSSSSSLSI